MTADSRPATGADQGQRFVVEHWPGLRRHRVVDLATDRTVGPTYLHHADAQTAADRLNGPRQRPTSQQGDLFQTQEAK